MVWKRGQRCEASQCAEVQDTGKGVEIRSSLRPGVKVEMTYEEWHAFLASAKAGDFDFVGAGSAPTADISQSKCGGDC